MAKPILVIQMHRMGDMVMSFPLFEWLARAWPEHPVWVAAQPPVSMALQGIGPKVRHVSPSDPALKTQAFLFCLNLSTREEAAALAGRVRTEALFGPFRTSDGRLYIRGDWNLYRSSLTDNSRHNRFHWSELYGLDLVPDLVQGHVWPTPMCRTGIPARIGLFPGASTAAKTPGVDFWVSLAQRLLRQNYAPVLLGGKAESSVGRAISRALPAKVMNLCGQTDLPGLMRVFASLNLLIAPDTGPMHLASWTGLPVLNLSMGPVYPWDTGPFRPGNWIVRSGSSCTGCWSCRQTRVYCADAVTATKISSLVGRILRKKTAMMDVSALRVWSVRRDADGLYDLALVEKKARPEAREYLGAFWKAFFRSVFGPGPALEPKAKWLLLRQTFPDLAQSLARSRLRLALVVGRQAKSSSACGPLSFWRSFPPGIRPLTSYVQHALDNGDHGRDALKTCLSLIDSLPFDL